MTRVIVAVFLVLGILLASSCATLKHDPPAECENSIVYQYAPWSFVMLTGAIDGCYAISMRDPALYAQIRQAARQAEIVLQGSSATYEQLSSSPNMSLLLTSQLVAIFRPDQVIEKCDRDVLFGYLRMI